VAVYHALRHARGPGREEDDGRRPARRRRRILAGPAEQWGERPVAGSSRGGARDEDPRSVEGGGVDSIEGAEPARVHNQPARPCPAQRVFGLRSCIAGVQRRGDRTGREARQVRQHCVAAIRQHHRDPLPGQPVAAHRRRKRTHRVVERAVRPVLVAGNQRRRSRGMVAEPA
jgi:hypothetical protein